MYLADNFGADGGTFDLEGIFRNQGGENILEFAWPCLKKLLTAIKERGYIGPIVLYEIGSFEDGSVNPDSVTQIGTLKDLVYTKKDISKYKYV